jgi:hypothetical protein
MAKKIRSGTKSIINILGYTEYNGETITNIFQKFSIKQSNLLNVNFYDEYIVQSSDRWDSISYKFYNTTTLWWMIANYNGIFDPFEELVVGEKIKIVKPELVSSLILGLRNR